MKIPYKVQRMKRNNMRLIVRRGQVIVQASPRTPQMLIQAFVEKNEAWILKHLPSEAPDVVPYTKAEFDEMKKSAALDLPERLKYWAPIVGVKYGHVTLRMMKSRWGSCRAKGDITLNILLMEMPVEIRDYVVVHELCHRLYMNHSKEYYKQVERVLPDYRQRVKLQKELGRKVMVRAYPNG